MIRAAAALACLACIWAFASGNAPQAPGGELRFCIPGDPKTFDPLQVSETNGELIRYLTAGVLVRVERNTGALSPELAESWRVADDGRTIRFRLKPNLHFSDGSALDSNDVARTLEIALDPKNASPAGDPFRSSAGPPVIETPSPRDVVIRYRNPKPALDRLFDDLAIVPHDRSRQLPATGGPFFAADYKPGVYVLLKRNPWYPKRDAAGVKLPYFDSIRIDIQTNRDLELARFGRGEIAVVGGLDPETFDRIKKIRPDAAHDLGPSLTSEFLWFNASSAPGLAPWKRKWFSSAAFRHAISGSIHREDIVRIAYKGYAHAAAGPVSPANRLWFNSNLKPFTANDSALKELLAQGFSLRDGVLRDSEGHNVEFSLITSAGRRDRERTAALIQSDLRRIGIHVNIVTLDFGSLIERIAKAGAYEACLLGFSSEIDPMNEMNVWLSSGAQHAWWPLEKTPATSWEARIDQLELAQASTGSPQARKQAFNEIQEIVVREEPIIYLVNPDYLYAISPALKGAKPAVAPPQLLWNIEWLRF